MVGHVFFRNWKVGSTHSAFWSRSYWWVQYNLRSLFTWMACCTRCHTQKTFFASTSIYLAPMPLIYQRSKEQVYHQLLGYRWDIFVLLSVNTQISQFGCLKTTTKLMGGFWNTASATIASCFLWWCLRFNYMMTLSAFNPTQFIQSLLLFF